jgi:Zn-dependent protease
MFGEIGQGGLRFQLFGFPVRIDPSFWIVTALLGLSWREVGPEFVLIWVAVVLVSILAHELGHAVAGRWFGLRGEIALYSMGGVTSWPLGRHLRHHWQEIVVSLAGPATGLLLGGVVFAATLLHGEPESPHLRIALFMLSWINFVWALLNLLPIVPLDGGHIMASTIHWFRRYEDPALPSLISIIFAAAVALLAWRSGDMFGTLLVAAFAAQNIMQLRLYGPIHPKDLRVALGVLLFVTAGTFALLEYLGLLEKGLLP